jgi:hypothetical protein
MNHGWIGWFELRSAVIEASSLVAGFTTTTPALTACLGDVERVDLLLAVVVDRRIDTEDAEDRERRRRPAVGRARGPPRFGCRQTGASSVP